MAHGVPRRSQGTIGRTHVGTKSHTDFAQGRLGHVGTQQVAPRIHGTALVHLHGCTTSAPGSTAGRRTSGEEDTA